eukprot:4202714-Alexandrium_andersonii.AAC.1
MCIRDSHLTGPLFVGSGPILRAQLGRAQGRPRPAQGRRRGLFTSVARAFLGTRDVLFRGLVGCFPVVAGRRAEGPSKAAGGFIRSPGHADPSPPRPFQ